MWLSNTVSAVVLLAGIITLSTYSRCIASAPATTSADKSSAPAVRSIETSAIDRRVYWGDSHLHSSYSADAGLLGNTLNPDQAYRFAKGEVVTSSTGLDARLNRPLDWLVLADHAENLGLIPMVQEANPVLLANPWGKRFYELFKSGDHTRAFAHWFGAANLLGKDPMPNSSLMRTFWGRMLGFSKQHNAPGTFTALLGYEWTSSVGSSNLHRVVVFADNEDRVGQVLPFSAYDSQNPEHLWDWLDNYEQQSGGRVLAISHNGNLSNGLMFDDVTFTGEKLSPDYALRRSRWEPLYEVTQIKGDAEAHPLLSPDDEFSDYGTWDSGNFGHAPKSDDMLPNEYAREALKRGLSYSQSLGANPFKFGLVGASDSHTSLSTTQEENFFGKAPIVEPGSFPNRWEGKMTGRGPLKPGEVDSPDERAIDTLSAGLQGVWAAENTREALFDAMMRKETYATTGTRIMVRVFAGYDFDAADLKAGDLGQGGYSRGVPMGGELVDSDQTPGKRAPRLIVQAVKDPHGANLDRIQVVKGWADIEGNTYELVTDVACADGAGGSRGIHTIRGQLRCAEPVGSTVIGATATYTNTIGATRLDALWQDPNFDPSQRAFYYVRVLEIPTPRWSTYDAVRKKRKLPSGIVVEQQDRAYTSPIWYSPSYRR